MANQVQIREVGMRDGVQSIAEIMPIERWRVIPCGLRMGPFAGNCGAATGIVADSE